MGNAGKAIPSKAARNPPGSLYDGYMMAENVSGNVRIDLYDFDIGVEAPLNTRFCKVMGLDQARCFAILLIDAINKAEVEEAMAKRKRNERNRASHPQTFWSRQMR